MLRNATHVNVVLLISQEEVVHDGGLVQLGQRGHVLNAVHAAGVHRGERLPVEVRSLEVHHLQRRTKRFRLSEEEEEEGEDDEDVALRGKKVWEHLEFHC